MAEPYLVELEAPAIQTKVNDILGDNNITLNQLNALLSFALAERLERIFNTLGSVRLPGE